MDELKLLTELTESTPHPDATRLAPARELLLAVIAEEETPVVRPLRRRLIWAGVTAVGLAAASLAVIALRAPEPAAPPVPMAAPTAGEVLLAAASSAREAPPVVPREDQFIYAKSLRADGWYHEQWSSVDGTHDGYSIENGHEWEIPGCRKGLRTYPRTASEKAHTERCVPFRSYHGNLPVDGDGMLAHLEQSTHGEGTSPHDLATEAIYLLEGELAPGSRAAVFEVLAKIPGVTVRTDVTDDAGRPAISVMWLAGGVPGEFFLAPGTYEYRGRGGMGARVSFGVVDAVGQRP